MRQRGAKCDTVCMVINGVIVDAEVYNEFIERVAESAAAGLRCECKP